MSPTATDGKAPHSHRHIHDPGARKVLLLVVRHRPRLITHGKQIAAATHARPGHKPGRRVPRPNTKNLQQGLLSFRGDLLSLHHDVAAVRCSTRAGRHGAALLGEGLLTFDTSVRTYLTAVSAPDRATKAKLLRQAQDSNKRARRTMNTALSLLER
jgi:hypothetical protein